MSMRTKVLWSGIAACALAGLAVAEPTDELTVTGSRSVITPVGIDYVGALIKDVSLSYHIAVADLDLKSAAGAAVLDKRLSYAARMACDEIGRAYPVSKPAAAACVRAAIDKARAQVRGLLAASPRPPAG